MAEPNISIAITDPQLVTPDLVPFDWGGGNGVSSTFATPSAPYSLINEKFDVTMATAEDMLTRLVGADGTSGSLGTLTSIIEAFPTPAVTIDTVTVPDLSVTVDSRPTPDLTGIDTDFPSFDSTLGSMETLPSIDTSGLTPGDLPADITEVISWLESTYDTTAFDELYAQLSSDLSSGVGGLGGTVEQDTYDRAVARQVVENDRLYDEVDNLYSGQRWDLPSGAYVAAMEEVAAKITAKNLDLNIEILRQTAELAQKNQQFVITSLATLETVLKDFHNKKNDRSLDYEKAVAANAIAIYSENIRGYIAKAEAAKLYVEVQVENLKATVEYNKGLVASFAAESEAYGYLVSAKAAKNKAITDVYDSEVKGYDSETRAISENAKTQIASYGLKIENARIQLEGDIANAKSILDGYTSESKLRSDVATAIANIGMQSMASAYGAVNASAGVSYSGSESQSETVAHSESRGVSTSHSIANSKSTSNNQGLSQSESGSYVHTYEET